MDADCRLPRSLAHQWFWDGQEHVDPAKEANAQSTRLQNHTTTLAYEYARQGRDWESEMRQRAKEVSLMQQLGLPLAQPTQASPNDDNSDTENEEAKCRRVSATQMNRTSDSVRLG